MRCLMPLLVCLGGVLACGTTSWADDAALTDVFGAGVHAYNARDYQRAYRDFASAIDAGSRDPRVYYYRGLCNLVFGRSKEAQSDFSRGSQLEATDLDQFYDVSKSLERVQGRARLAVEQHRAAARVAAVQQREKLRLERYGVLRPGESAGGENVPAGGAQPAPPASPAAPAKPMGNPFGESPAAPPAPAPAEKPAEKPAPDNPFGAP